MLRRTRSVPGMVGLFGCLLFLVSTFLDASSRPVDPTSNLWEDSSRTDIVLLLLVLATASLLLISMSTATRALPVIAVGLSAFVLGNVLLLELPLEVFFEEPGQFVPVVGALIMLGGSIVVALSPDSPPAR